MLAECTSQTSPLDSQSRKSASSQACSMHEHVPVVIQVLDMCGLYYRCEGHLNPCTSPLNPKCCCRVAGVVHLTGCSLASTRAYTKWIKSLPGQQVTLRPIDPELKSQAGQLFAFSGSTTGFLVWWRYAMRVGRSEPQCCYSSQGCTPCGCSLACKLVSP